MQDFAPVCGIEDEETMMMIDVMILMIYCDAARRSNLTMVAWPRFMVQ